jgi:uncharacterized DUF497 family protein
MPAVGTVTDEDASAYRQKARAISYAAKDAMSQRRHGVSLALAHRFDWLTGPATPGHTVAEELRWKMVTTLEGIIYTTIFTRRVDVLWIISVRPASRRSDASMRGKQPYGVPDLENPGSHGHASREGTLTPPPKGETRPGRRRRGPSRPMKSTSP